MLCNNTFPDFKFLENKQVLPRISFYIFVIEHI